MGAGAAPEEDSGIIISYLFKLGFYMLAQVLNKESSEYLINMIKIEDEERLFNKDPIKYVLSHNDQAKFALNAMKNLEFHERLAQLLPQIHKVEACLEIQPEGVIEDLYAICGDSGLHYEL